jgi:predicted permease
MAALGSVNWSVELKGLPRRETVAAAFVSASFFDTLRARPLLGRAFLPEEDEATAGRVLVLSYGLWQRRFAGDPQIVGRQVEGSGHSFTIVGVMPREFDFPHDAQVWTPVAPELDSIRRRDHMAPATFRSLGVLFVLGRLKPGVTLDSARTELAALSRRLSIADGFSTKGWRAEMVPVVDHYLGRSTRVALQTLAVASALVLVLACANVTVILLVQAIARRTDLAVRQALGASAVRAALQEIGESVGLALAGGLAGALLAKWAVEVVVAFGPSDMPGLADARVDAQALAFALLVTLGVALFVSLAPAGVASRLAILPMLKARGGADRRGVELSRLLVAAEVALSIVLVVGSGLMARSLGKLLEINLGFVPERALCFSVELATEKYGPLVERLAALPGVEAAGGVHNRPLEYGAIGSDNRVVVEGQPLDHAWVTANSINVNWEVATPGYFRAIGTRRLAGRDFDAHDRADSPKVAIVSESLARRCWPGESALGKRLHTFGAKEELKDGVFVVEWQTVVGVVEDARYRGIQNPRFDVFLPYGQVPSALQVVVRSTADPATIASLVREEVRLLDPEAQVEDLATMTSLVDRALLPWRFTSALLGGFAFVALVLTASGLFAVLHHFVSGRTREIAIRMALGAGPRRVQSFVLGQGLGVTAMGVGLGLAVSALGARSLSSLLYEVGERDPRSYLGGAALIGLVAVAASLLPARRAARVEPTVALRSE